MTGVALAPEGEPIAPDAEELDRTTQIHLRHFERTDSRCRGLQLPDGLMLRFNQSTTLFFYLRRTEVKDGKIVTRVFVSDSPYDREKAFIGELARRRWTTRPI
jgi:hypothetical protein